MTNRDLEQLQQSIERLLGTEQQCACGRTHPVSTRAALIDSGAIDQLPQLVAELGLTGPSLLVADPTTYEVAGARVKAVMAQEGLQTDTLILSAAAGQPHLAATGEGAEEVRRQATNAAYMLAVGSGTINDLVKLAATRLQVPYVAVATAPSMTGYSSALAAILASGVKQAVPAEPPVAIVADLDILAAAPPIMTAAGLGDLISRSLSSADWKMSSLLLGTYYCPAPAAVIAQADQYCRSHVAQIRGGEPEGIAVLTAGLILAGMSITMARTSAPGSGGGHLISHYWDMTATARGRRPALHGCQVAVGDLACFTLYEKLRSHLERLDLEKIASTRSTRDQLGALTREHYAPLIGPGPASVLGKGAAAAHAGDESLRRQLQGISRDPAAFWVELDALLTPPAEARGLLKAGGVPTTVAELGISPDEMRNAYLYARLIRPRYTGLDLAYDSGLLEQLRDEVLTASGVLG